MTLPSATVSTYMSTSVRAVFPSDTLELARERLLEWEISALAVLDEYEGALRLCGVLSRTNLVRVGESHGGPALSVDHLSLPAATVASAMTESVVCVREGDSLETAARLMTKHRYHRLFVERDSGVVGVLSTRDLMRAVADKEIEEPLSKYMSAPVVALPSETPIADAVEAFSREDVSTIVVLGESWPCGVFTKQDALRAKAAAGSTLSDVMNPDILVVPETTTLHRVAAKAATTDVRCVIVSRDQLMVGVLSGLDFCRALI